MGICYSKNTGRGGEGERCVMEKQGSGLSSPKWHSKWNKKGREKKSSGNGEEESLLDHIPGRFSSNGSSNIASLYTQQGKKGTNQDAMLVWENFSSRTDTVFCGVFDGHGPFGHMVAKRARDSLPLILSTQWQSSLNGEKKSTRSESTNSEENASLSMDDESYDSVEVEGSDKLPEMFIPLKKSFLKAFKLMDKELKFHPTIDCFCSGTTAVTLIKQGQEMVIGNVGDSRAVLATRDADNSLIAIQLTVDLKPDLPTARIQQFKGRVFALQDEPEVARLWLPNNDSPGLAMARAFGDFCLKDFGLISVPDIYHHQITERDAFIIMATDGVWDVLSNKEAVDVVASAPGRAMAARALVDCAIRAWRLKYPTSKNDDCAVVCLFLEPLSAANRSVEECKIEHNCKEAEVNVVKINENVHELELSIVSDASALMHLDTIKAPDEIVPVSELSDEKLSARIHSQSKRSLAECISTADDDEEWSALEGITRVNSLLSLPRLLSTDKRSTSWRKWL